MKIVVGCMGVVLLAAGLIVTGAPATVASWAAIVGGAALAAAVVVLAGLVDPD